MGEADRGLRARVFDWLTLQREAGETLARSSLEAFEIGGRRIPLVGPSGIWKPAAFDLPLSITTTFGGPYADSYDDQNKRLRYAYRGTDPNHRDNIGLKRAMLERVPLVYFHAIAQGRYVAAYPAFVVAENDRELTFSVQIDDAQAGLAAPANDAWLREDDVGPRRAYVTAVFRRRLHQAAFRERVIRAYGERCALCRLRHQELLEAAHITADVDPEGEPVVSNGLALCKLHHAAFDRFFLTIRPDYVVEVRQSILDESDGPMLVVGLQQMHGRSIHVPTQPAHRPDRERLERRYAEFLEAGR